MVTPVDLPEDNSLDKNCQTVLNILMEWGDSISVGCPISTNKESSPPSFSSRPSKDETDEKEYESDHGDDGTSSNSDKSEETPPKLSSPDEKEKKEPPSTSTRSKITKNLDPKPKSWHSDKRRSSSISDNQNRTKVIASRGEAAKTKAANPSIDTEEIRTKTMERDKEGKLGIKSPKEHPGEARTWNLPAAHPAP